MAENDERGLAAKIEENSQAINRQMEYLRQIRDFHMPWANSAFWSKVRVKVVRPMLRVTAAITVCVSIYKGTAWYWQKQKLHEMSSRYAQVAGRLYEEENNPEVALLFLDKALEIESEEPEYIFRRAYLQGMVATRRLSAVKRPFTKEELDQAHASYAEAVYLQQLQPKRSEPYVLQAQLLTVLKEPDKARAAIARAVELDPGNDYALVQKAVIQLECEKDVEGAEATIDRALEINPDSKWAWLQKGRIALQTRKGAVAARECYDRALEIDPRFDMAHYQRGWTHAFGAEKDYGLARAEMKQALAINPSYKEALYAMARFYSFENNPAVAMVWIDKALALDDKYLDAHRERGAICGALGDHEEAIRSLDAAISLDPMDADLYQRRAKMEIALGRTVKALCDLRFALELNPARPETVLVALGEVYLKSGDVDAALSYFNQALERAPRYVEAAARKAEALEQVNRLEEALEALSAALTGSHLPSTRYLLQKGTLLEKMGRLEESLACFVELRTANPKHEQAWKREGLLLRRLNRSAESRAAFLKYLELVPMDADVRALVD